MSDIEAGKMYEAGSIFEIEYPGDAKKRAMMLVLEKPILQIPESISLISTFSLIDVCEGRHFAEDMYSATDKEDRIPGTSILAYIGNGRFSAEQVLKFAKCVGGMNNITLEMFLRTIDPGKGATVPMTGKFQEEE